MRREWEPEDLIACWTLVEAAKKLRVRKAALIEELEAFPKGGPVSATTGELTEAG